MASASVTVCIAPADQIGHLAVDRLALALERNGSAFVGMATGSTPKVTNFWGCLRDRVKRGLLDPTHATFCNPDEWIGLGPGHPESYRSYLNTELTDHFVTNILVPNGDANDPVAAAVAAENAIVNGGGFEWMLLGMGINGHIGFYEPCETMPSHAFSPAIDEVNRTRYATDHFGGTMDKVPTHATTIGLGTVMRSREICLCVVGEGKAKLVASALSGPVNTMLPASLLQLGHNVKVFLDPAAAAQLDLRALGRRPGWTVQHKETVSFSSVWPSCWPGLLRAKMKNFNNRCKCCALCK